MEYADNEGGEVTRYVSLSPLFFGPLFLQAQAQLRDPMYTELLTKDWGAEGYLARN
jgi:hypothetical protein